jgi:hypothetical protein
MSARGKVGPLDLKRFWDVIGASIRPTRREQLEALLEQLARMRREEIIGFDLRLWDLIGKANRVDVWAAAYVVRGGCSDDGFCYFRAWLVSQGRRVFEKVLADPESLIEVPCSEGRYDSELLLGAARNAWERQIETISEEVARRAEAEGREDFEEPELPDFDQERKTADRVPYQRLVGDEFDFRDTEEMRRRFPRLAAYLERQ